MAPSTQWLRMMEHSQQIVHSRWYVSWPPEQSFVSSLVSRPLALAPVTPRSTHDTYLDLDTSPAPLVSRRPVVTKVEYPLNCKHSNTQPHTYIYIFTHTYVYTNTCVKRVETISEQVRTYWNFVRRGTFDPFLFHQHDQRVASSWICRHRRLCLVNSLVVQGEDRHLYGRGIPDGFSSLRSSKCAASMHYGHAHSYFIIMA